MKDSGFEDVWFPYSPKTGQFSSPLTKQKTGFRMLRVFNSFSGDAGLWPLEVENIPGLLQRYHDAAWA